MFLFFLLSLIIIIIIVSITYRGQLLVISCKKYVRYKWSCCCCYDEKKKTHFVPPITFSLKQVCLDINLCIASLSEVTTIRNLNGLQDIISAMNCTCAPRERGSRRVSAEHVQFMIRGTKYETRVDIGQCIRRCRVHGESWIMLLESFRFEDEDEIYLDVFLTSILKNYTRPESFIILLSRWYSRFPITRTLANSNQNRFQYQFQDWDTRINSVVRPVPYVWAQPWPGQWQPWTAVSPLLRLINIS